MSSQTVDILIVDDSAAEAAIFQEILRESHPSATIFWVPTGEAAIRYLQRQGEYADVSTVKLVILDLNMPGLSGLDTLRIIRNSPSINLLPVVLLSSSRNRSDVDHAYSLGASAFFSKPMSLDLYIQKVRVLVQHWLRSAELPSVAALSRRATSAEHQR